MAFNSLEYLENGKVEFVERLTLYDKNNLIKYVRDHERKDDIINGFLSKLIDIQPGFCFDIIYDNPKYAIETKYILDNYYTIDNVSKEQLIGVLNNSSIGQNYFEENFEAIIKKYIKDIDFVFTYMFDNINANFSLLQTLAIHPNLKVRYLFMKFLLAYHSDFINFFYDDITKYLTSETFSENEQLTFLPVYMNMSDVCELAYTAFINKKMALWEKLKNYILQNYESNDLAYQLLTNKLVKDKDGCWHLVSSEEAKEEFKKDANTLFQTSNGYRTFLLNHHRESIDKKILDDFLEQFKYFFNKGELDDSFTGIDYNGLSRDLALHVDKYLELSKDKSYEYLEAGSTASCFRIGDFVFKLVKTKWSYEPIICPNLYLILPNLEEKFIRRNDGVIISGIEIQRYLPRSARGVPTEIFEHFKNELLRLGYYTTDSLMDGDCGDNCRLLNSYTDSSNPNPPNWFKEYPLVLVDSHVNKDLYTFDIS